MQSKSNKIRKEIRKQIRQIVREELNPKKANRVYPEPFSWLKNPAERSEIKDATLKNS